VVLAQLSACAVVLGLLVRAGPLHTVALWPMGAEGRLGAQHLHRADMPQASRAMPLMSNVRPH